MILNWNFDKINFLEDNIIPISLLKEIKNLDIYEFVRFDIFMIFK